MAKRRTEEAERRQGSDALRQGVTRPPTGAEAPSRGSDVAELRRLIELGLTAPSPEALFQSIVEQISAWMGFPIVSIEILDASHTDTVPAGPAPASFIVGTAQCRTFGAQALGRFFDPALTHGAIKCRRFAAG